MVTSKALCVHVKSLCSGICPNEELQSWIGFHSSVDDETFLKWSSEVSTLFALCLQGRINEINPDDFSQIGFKHNQSGLTTVDCGGISHTPEFVPREPVLQTLVAQDGTLARTQKIWAGLMKMKTAVAPRTTRKPSVRKMKEHYVSITAPFSGDQTVFPEIEESVRQVTRAMVKHARVDSSTEEKYYLPLYRQPAKDKGYHTLSSTSLADKSAKRTKLEAFNCNGLLRLEEIQNLYSMDPDIFCSRLFLGYKAKNCSLDLSEYPLVPSDTIPLSRVSYIPKPGDKERVVCVPTALMQSLSYPIGKIAKTLNSSWRIQGVDSHEKCCEDIADLIQKFNGSKTFYSIDMSNFTDRLPYLGLISVVVDELVNIGVLKPFDKAVMDTVCLSKIRINGTISAYGVGTPMGTFPSFPLASFANGVLASIAYARGHFNGDLTKIRLNDVPAKIIGDDIVVWDDNTHKNYVSLMERLGVSIQPSKCIAANYVAEMCSKIITDKGVFQQKKIDTLATADSLQSFIDQYTYYGDEILEYVDPTFVDDLLSLQLVPYPMGTGPKIEDPFWDSEVALKNLYVSMGIARRYKRLESASLDALDYTIIEDRVGLYPRSLKFEPDIPESSDPYQRNQLIESLRRDMDVLYDILISTESTLEDKEDAAYRVGMLDKAIRTLDSSHYLEKLDRDLDYHLHDRGKTSDQTKKLADWSKDTYNQIRRKYEYNDE